jgi:type II secretory pathway component GspD/PulD (secretin)
LLPFETMRISIPVLACVIALASSPTAMAAVPKPEATPAGECRKLPAGKRLVRLSLKPKTDVADLIAWISSITCKQFVMPGSIADGKTVTIVSPQLITPEEAYRLFLDALDSVGLTVYPFGPFLRVIPVEKAKQSPIPTDVVSKN